MTHEPPSTQGSYPSESPGLDRGIPYQEPAPVRRLPVNLPSKTPLVTYTLMGITILAFLLQQASQTVWGYDLPASLGLKVNNLIVEGQLWRLVTPMFLHASILHIGFNMYGLYVFGPGLERFSGHVRFLVLYFLAGFAGNVFSFIFTANPSLGSSTAIFGLLGAEGVFLYRNRGLMGGFARRALTNIIMIAAINFMISFTVPGIDFWGHLGGLAGGALFTWFGGPVLGLEGLPPSLSVADQRETRDVVLAAFGVALLFSLLAVGTLYMRAS